MTIDHGYDVYAQVCLCGDVLAEFQKKSWSPNLTTKFPLYLLWNWSQNRPKKISKNRPEKISQNLNLKLDPTFTFSLKISKKLTPKKVHL